MTAIIGTTATILGYTFVATLALIPTLAIIAGIARTQETRLDRPAIISDTLANLAYRSLYLLFTSGIAAIILHNIALMLGQAN